MRRFYEGSLLYDPHEVGDGQARRVDYYLIMSIEGAPYGSEAVLIRARIVVRLGADSAAGSRPDLGVEAGRHWPGVERKRHHASVHRLRQRAWLHPAHLPDA